MNKPAAKEPSMDEILSSIRQIIADDDATVDATPSSVTPAEELVEELPSFDAFVAEEEPSGAEDLMAASVDDMGVEDMDDALALSAEQIVAPDDALGEGDTGAIDFSDSLVDPDDISFDVAPETAPVVPTMPEALPDPTLSADLADHLLEPASQQAASYAFSKLGTIALGDQAITLEAMIKEMLRPMLKQWLDENLPSVVEKLVEKEIERVTRGGR